MSPKEDTVSLIKAILGCYKEYDNGSERTRLPRNESSRPANRTVP